jgi:hypothetical protein
VGRAFIHPEKVQTNTSKHQGLFVAHRLHLSHAEELGDIKMLGHGGLKSYLS